MSFSEDDYYFLNLHSISLQGKGGRWKVYRRKRFIGYLRTCGKAGPFQVCPPQNDDFEVVDSLEEAILELINLYDPDFEVDDYSSE